MALFKGTGTYFATEPILMENLTNVYIGSYCSIGRSNVFDQGWAHNIRAASLYPFNKLFPQQCGHITTHPISKGDIKISDGVWSGHEVIFCSGINIGRGSIIGARSIVTKDVESYSIVAGSPAKFIRKRFDQWKIDLLETIKWWEWDLQYLLKFADLLQSDKDEHFRELEKIYYTFIKK